MSEFQSWLLVAAAVLGSLGTCLRAVVALLTYIRERR